MKNVECLGWIVEQKMAERLAEDFNAHLMLIACGGTRDTTHDDMHKTHARAVVDRLTCNGAVIGFLVRVERRDPMLVGHPWGTVLSV